MASHAAAWLLNRVLPGVLSSLAVIGISHVKLRRHITRTADEQTRTLTSRCQRQQEETSD